MNRKVHAGFGPADEGSTARKLTASASSDWHLLFHDDKAQLHRWRHEIADFLATLRLTLHEGKSAVLPVRLGVNFVGFRVFPTHRRLRRENVRRVFRRLREQRTAYQAGEIPIERINASLQSWIAHSQHASTYGLRRALFRQVTF